jgi:cysteine-S-conjugate beta-lyase
MDNNRSYSFQTNLLHNKHKVDGQTGATSVSIQHASTFHQTKLNEFGAFDYARSSNPTRNALEETIAELEGGRRGFAFSSGMAAISTVFMLLKSGDHVVISEDVYGGTYRLITNVLHRFGVEYTFVNMRNLDAVEKSIKPNTKVLYIETPSNPLLHITDIRSIVRIAEKYNCLTFADNTFMTPALQRPLDLGVDVVLYSATKFIAGHSDVVAGLAVVKDKKLGEQIGFLQNTFGSILGVQDCWLVLRGLKTLHIRLKQSTDSAEKIVTFLESHSSIQKVYYPGISTHAGNHIHRNQAESFGAVFSFTLQSEQEVKTFIEQVKIPVFAVSLGAVESIVSHPATMSHAAMPEEERLKRGITNGLLRFSVGLEQAEELIQDFEHALLEVEKARHLA